MTRVQKIIVTCTSLAVPGGCIGLDPTSVTQIRPEGDAFQSALHAEYAELAVKESTLYDWRDATIFAEKALAAAAGRDVPPEEPGIWGIDPLWRDDLEVARQRMVTLLERTSAKTDAPAPAAAAQAAYDCWLEEQEEGHQPDAIQACRNRWETAMVEVQTVLQPSVQPAAAPPGGGDPPEYEIFFPIGRTELSPAAEAVVRGVVEMARQAGPARITVAGHADRSGPRAYNERLSAARADAVGAELIRLGVPAHLVHSTGFGEDHPAVRTSDGRAHPMNRRVVIRLL